jgi:acylaminoacyl-peptidase
VTRRPSALTHPSLEADNISDKPYDLGTRYCYNRYSSVELLNAPTSLEDAETALLSMTPVTDHHDMADFCCSSPRFSPDSKVLVYVSAPRKTDGRAQSSILPHNTTKVLRGACILGGADGPSASHPVTIVDVVGKAARDEFPGLYLHGLPSRPWLGASPSVPSRSILLSSVWGSELRVLQIPVHVDGAGDGACVRALVAGDVLDVTPAMPGAPCVRSVSVLDVCARGAVFSCSSPVHPDQIAFAAVSTGGAGIPAVAQLVSFPSRRARELEAMARPFCSVDLVLSQTAAADVDAAVAAREFAPGEDDASQRYQVTLLVPCSASRTSRVPLVVYPHGGPHSCSVNTFSQGAAAMLTAGLAVLHVNFRGSLGLGQESLESLPGRAGTQDVSEVLQATQWALQVGSPDFLDERRVGYVGGSHGGFLGAHCSVVPGNLFKAVALRNPVCNISSMVNVTDIPDWCFCEAGLAAVSEETGLALGADPAALSKMWSVSPVARVRKGGPRPGRTILFVGASDRRVPPEQSVEWQRLITESHGAGIVTLRWYPKSGHAIDEVPNGDDVWVHTLELLGTL